MYPRAAAEPAPAKGGASRSRRKNAFPSSLPHRGVIRAAPPPGDASPGTLRGCCGASTQDVLDPSLKRVSSRNIHAVRLTYGCIAAFSVHAGGVFKGAALEVLRTERRLLPTGEITRCVAGRARRGHVTAPIPAGEGCPRQAASARGGGRAWGGALRRVFERRVCPFPSCQACVSLQPRGNQRLAWLARVVCLGWYAVCRARWLGTAGASPGVAGEVAARARGHCGAWRASFPPPLPRLPGSHM
jgi:hypothetical protein